MPEKGESGRYGRFLSLSAHFSAGPIESVSPADHLVVEGRPPPVYAKVSVVVHRYLLIRAGCGSSAGCSA